MRPENCSGRFKPKAVVFRFDWAGKRFIHAVLTETESRETGFGVVPCLIHLVVARKVSLFPILLKIVSV